jgi:GntR family transcriptional regulator
VSPRPTRAEYVRDSLLSELRAGKYLVGEKLPNEDDLAFRFDVSRATVREAVQGLLEVGDLRRKHGLGTFVTSMPSHQHSLDMTLSYTAMIRSAGMEPGDKVVDRVERAATPEEADRLGVDQAEMLVCIRRVRTADGVPAIYSEDRIPRVLLQSLEGAPLDTSLYVLLAQAGLSIHHAVATLRPVIADAPLSRLLGVPRGSALQYIDQVDFIASGTAAMLSSEWHVPGVFELVINRRPLVSESESGAAE